MDSQAAWTLFGERMYSHNCIGQQERNNHKQILVRLADHLRSFDELSQTGLQLYGSTSTGFGSRDNFDLDTSLVTRSTHLSLGARRQLVHRVASALQYYGDNRYIEVEAIVTTRVPVVRLNIRTNRYTYQTDIAIDNEVGVENSELLRAYAEFDTRVAKLVLMVKSFMKTTPIGDRSHRNAKLNSYATCLMVIHYLQQSINPVLPVLQDMRGRWQSSEEVYRTAASSATGRKWRVDYVLPTARSLPGGWYNQQANDMSLGELFVGFFYYYANVFNFDLHVVCIHQKDPLRKCDAAYLHDEFRDVSIQDPIEKSHNLGITYEYSEQQHTGLSARYPLERWFQATHAIAEDSGSIGFFDTRSELRSWVEDLNG